MLILFLLVFGSGFGLSYFLPHRRETYLQGLALPDLVVESVRSPADARVHYFLAQQYMSWNEFAAAEGELRRSLTLRPSAEAYRELGAIMAATGRQQEALAAFEKAIALNPRMWQTYRQRALVFVEREEYPRASQDLIKALELNPVDADLHLLAGRSFVTARMDEEAMRTLSVYIRMRPHDAEGYAVLGSAHLEFGRIDDARETLERAIRLDENNTLAHRALARVYLKRGALRSNLERALNHFQIAARLDPQDGEAQWEIGQVFLRLNLPKDAVTALRRAVHLVPRDYRAYYTLATAYRRIGDDRQAMQVLASEKLLREYHNEVLRLHTVIQARPNDYEARLQLAKWHRKVGSIQEAVQELQALLNGDPADAFRREAISELTEIEKSAARRVGPNDSAEGTGH